ncbi:hypothetical protein FPOAC2_09523 [Fusarium poae]
MSWPAVIGFMTDSHIILSADPSSPSDDPQSPPHAQSRAPRKHFHPIPGNGMNTTQTQLIRRDSLRYCCSSFAACYGLPPFSHPILILGRCWSTTIQTRPVG